MHSILKQLAKRAFLRLLESTDDGQMKLAEN